MYMEKEGNLSNTSPKFKERTWPSVIYNTALDIAVENIKNPIDERRAEAKGGKCLRNKRSLDGIERFFKIDKKKHSGNVCKIGICDSIVNEAGIFCDGPAFQKPPGHCRLRLEAQFWARMQLLLMQFCNQNLIEVRVSNFSIRQALCFLGIKEIMPLLWVKLTSPFGSFCFRELTR